MISSFFLAIDSSEVASSPEGISTDHKAGLQESRVGSDRRIWMPMKAQISICYSDSQHSGLISDQVSLPGLGAAGGGCFLTGGRLGPETAADPLSQGYVEECTAVNVIDCRLLLIVVTSIEPCAPFLLLIRKLFFIRLLLIVVTERMMLIKQLWLILGTIIVVIGRG